MPAAEGQPGKQVNTCRKIASWPGARRAVKGLKVSSGPKMEPQTIVGLRQKDNPSNVDIKAYCVICGLKVSPFRAYGGERVLEHVGDVD